MVIQARNNKDDEKELNVYPRFVNSEIFLTTAIRNR